MKKLYDSSSDIMWIVYKKGAEEYYEEIAPGIIMEFDENNEPLGIEIQNYSRLFTSKSLSLSADSISRNFFRENFPLTGELEYDYNCLAN